MKIVLYFIALVIVVGIMLIGGMKLRYKIIDDRIDKKLIEYGLIDK